MVEMLIEAGADVNVKDGDGRTPLAMGRERLRWGFSLEEKKIIDILRRAGGH